MKEKILLALCFTIVIDYSILAQAGNLDSTYGMNGKVELTMGCNLSASGLAIQPSGKCVVAGTIDTCGYQANHIIFLRFNNNGTLDSSFGINGTTIIRIPLTTAGANSMVMQPDGKIVATGWFSNSSATDGIMIVRCDSNGTLDPTFGSGGILMTSFCQYPEQVASLAVEEDGKILIAGGAANDFALARYSSDGVRDSSFGVYGVVITDFNGTAFSEGASAIVLQTDGKIVAAGDSYNGTNFEFALARYHADGSLDSSFNNDGKITTVIDSSSFAYALAIQTDGEIVVAGASTDIPRDFALARYKVDGDLDSSFGSNGVLTTDFGGADDQSISVTIQPDGKPVAAGRADFEFGLARYHVDGSLDSSFGDDGLVTTYFGGQDGIRQIVIQPDGKILAVGFSYGVMTLARYISGLNVGINSGTNTDATVSIFPNPASGFLNIEISSSCKNALLQLINSLGEIVYEKKLEANQAPTMVDVSNLAPGIYWAVITCGETIMQKKVVVQR